MSAESAARQFGRGVALTDEVRRPTLADLVDAAVASLRPFERSAVTLRYGAGHGVGTTARTLDTTSDEVAAALMRAYRVIAAGLHV